MVSSVFPHSLLNSTYIPAFGCDPLWNRASRGKTDTVLRAQAGDQVAFSELYTRHKRLVLSTCMQMVHDRALAEDLAQEVFLQLHRKLASFRGDSAFSTWLHRMTVNIVLMHLRKRVLPLVSLDCLMTGVPEERAVRDFGARDLAQLGVVDRLAIDRAVDTLAPGYRSVFLLHDVHGFQHSEIASMRGCTLGTSKSQLHKARRALRGVLAAHSDSTAAGSKASK
jgi:RNA polymerase sigma-70 factor (ECF subfamily)